MPSVVTVSMLKDKRESVQSIMDRIAIDPENRDSLRELITDLRKLKDALVSKREKIKSERAAYENFDFNSLMLNHVYLKKLEGMKHLLDLRDRINALLRVEKFAKMVFEMKTDARGVIERCLHNYEDVEFWSFFLSEVLGNDEIRAYLKDVSVDFVDLKLKSEEKIRKVFEDNIETLSSDKSIETCKIAYRASLYLNHNEYLVKIFINNISIIKKPYFVEPREYSEVRIDESESPSMISELVAIIKRVYQDELKCVEKVFDDPQVVFTKVNKRIMNDVIVGNLNRLLKCSDPFVYLNTLKESYLGVRSLLEYIQSLYPTISMSTSSDLSEVFSPFISKIPSKEREAFDVAFNILVSSADTKTRYIMSGKRLCKSHNPDVVFNRLAIIFNFTLKRMNMFFGSQHPEGFCDSFFCRFCEFFARCQNIHDKEKLVTVRRLSEYYVVLSGMTTDGIKPLYDFVVLETQSLFKGCIESSVKYIEKLFSAFSYDEYSCDGDILPTIKSVVSYLNKRRAVAEMHIPGNNKLRYLGALLKAVRRLFYKKMLNHVYTVREGIKLTKNVKHLRDWVKVGAPHMIAMFEYLVEMSLIISSNKDDLRMVLVNIFERLNANEKKAIIRCREDYKEVKAIVEFAYQ